jgi:hypothetical protein
VTSAGEGLLLSIGIRPPTEDRRQVAWRPRSPVLTRAAATGPGRCDGR